MARKTAFRPFEARGKRDIVAILLTFALVSTVSVGLSIGATARSQHQAAVLEIAARQRTLAQRYVGEILLVRSGLPADPASTASLLADSAKSLLEGGTAPAVNGDDDEVDLPAESGGTVRAQLEQERRLVADLTATGDAILAGRPVTAVPTTADEHLTVTDPLARLRVLAALTANVSLDSARMIAARADRNVSHLILLQILLGAGGLVISLALALALVAAARRQTAHFRSLVTSSTDLVLVFGEGECRYVSQSVADALGQSQSDLHGGGFVPWLHPEDRVTFEAAATDAGTREILFRLRNRSGEWRFLEAHVTDLRNDRRIRGIVLNARDVTERVQLEDELSKAAFSDSLTGLANRALFRDHVTQALARAVRGGRAVAVLLADLDGFKAVNDSLGHDAGDKVLVEVASRLAQCVRPGDTVARLGGDEFTILLEDVGDLASAKEAAVRILEVVRSPLGDHGQFRIGASIGVALSLNGSETYEDLLRNADTAMYAAKNSGRGRVATFEPAMHARVREQLRLSLDLENALDRGELVLHYQPTFSLATRELEGAEALARWHHPDGRLVRPDVFIPIAEQSGQIIRIGRWVLNEACQQAAIWQRDFPVSPARTIGVNVSGRQLGDGQFIHDVRAVLRNTGLEPDALVLELTESILMEDVEAVTRRLHELKELGVRLAIDDFGTGYSSLAYLRRFPIDILKIDRTFVEAAAKGNGDGAALVRAIIDLGTTLRLATVAEGIEQPSQAEHMLTMGCTSGQGFLFARPMPLSQLTELLRQTARVPVEPR